MKSPRWPDQVNGDEPWPQPRLVATTPSHGADCSRDQKSLSCRSGSCHSCPSICGVPTTLRKMPRLSEPGPFGMRAERWYDFGDQAGNSNLFAQVVPHSVLQYLRSGQITLADTDGSSSCPFFAGLLSSQSWPRRNQWPKCAGHQNNTEWDPLMVPIERTKQIKKLRRLIPPESLLLLTSRLPSRMSHVEPTLHSIEQTDPDLAAVFSKWYTGTTKHRMHCESACTQISASSGIDLGCLLTTCGFSAAIDPVLQFVLADTRRLHDSGAKLFAFSTTAVDQTEVYTADIRSHDSSHQISQPPATALQDSGVASFLPRPHPS